MSDRGSLYLGIKGYVVCINKLDGSEKWRTKLKGSQITTLIVHETELFASAQGYLYALDQQSGRIVWENPLRGLGNGVCTLGLD